MDVESEAFVFWFASKYEAQNIGDNLWAFSLDVEGQKVVTFLFMWGDFWSVACPIMHLDKKSKQNAFEIMVEHSERSAMGLTVIEDMLCVVNCSNNFNAPDADEWIQGFAAHAADLAR